MKKLLVTLIIVCILLTSAGCSNKESEMKIEALSTELSDAKTELKEVKAEFEEYKTKMQPYEQLSEKDIKIKEKEQAELLAQLEAQEKARKEKEAEEEAKRKAEEAKKLAEEAKGYETGTTYKQLARTPDDYIGKKVKFKGQVVQVIEGETEVQLRLAINSDYDQIALVSYDKSITSSRVLEDDTITIYGISSGLITYQSTMGGNITIPSIVVDRIDQ